MGEQGMVPLFYHVDIKTAQQVLSACYRGRATYWNSTNRGDFAHEVFGELNKYCVKELPRMIMGLVGDRCGNGCPLPAVGAILLLHPYSGKILPLCATERKCYFSTRLWLVDGNCSGGGMGVEIVKLFPGSTCLVLSKPSLVLSPRRASCHRRRISRL